MSTISSGHLSTRDRDRERDRDRKTVDRIAFVRAERIPHHDTLSEGQHRVFAQEVPADGNAHGVQRIAGSIFKEIGMSDSRRRTIATYYK